MSSPHKSLHPASGTLDSYSLAVCIFGAHRSKWGQRATVATCVLAGQVATTPKVSYRGRPYCDLPKGGEQQKPSSVLCTSACDYVVIDTHERVEETLCMSIGSMCIRVNKRMMLISWICTFSHLLYPRTTLTMPAPHKTSSHPPTVPFPSASTTLPTPAAPSPSPPQPLS